MNEKARVIAYYLPQFHPTPENDEWWGKGFTEWTNVGRASKLFKGHYQPRVPADLGYYDLRVPETREAQADMAKRAGIEGFAYWHYWWAGKRLLEKPMEEVLKLKKPDFPFCLAWANESWSGIWHGLPNKILMEQTYPGKEDYVRHFNAMLEAFLDERYITVDGRLLFVVYKPLDIPNPRSFMELWNELAVKNGLKGFYFVGVTGNPTKSMSTILELGFDGVNTLRTLEARDKIEGKVINRLKMKLTERVGGLLLNKFKYSEIIKHLTHPDDGLLNVFPSVLPQWDNSPRSGRRGVIYTNSTPELFREHLQSAIQIVKEKPEQQKLIFLKSWNEWAEGNYVEPDLRYGSQYLDTLREILY